MHWLEALAVYERATESLIAVVVVVVVVAAATAAICWAECCILTSMVTMTRFHIIKCMYTTHTHTHTHTIIRSHAELVRAHSAGLIMCPFACISMVRLASNGIRIIFIFAFLSFAQHNTTSLWPYSCRSHTIERQIERKTGMHTIWVLLGRWERRKIVIAWKIRILHIFGHALYISSERTHKTDTYTKIEQTERLTVPFNLKTCITFGHINQLRWHANWFWSKVILKAIKRQ